MFIFKVKLKTLTIIAILTTIISILSIIMVYIGGFFIDVLLEATTHSDIFLLCFVILCIGLLNITLDYINTLITNTTGEVLVYEFKTYLLQHLQKVDMLEYRKFSVAYLSKRIDEDTRQLVSFFVANYINIIIKAIELLVLCVFLFRASLYIGVLTLLLSPLYFYVYKYFKEPVLKKSIEVREESAKFFQSYSNQLEYMEDIVIESKLEHSKNIVGCQFYTFYEKYKEHLLINNRIKFIQSFIVIIMQVVIFFVGGIAVLQGNSTIGINYINGLF